MLEINASDDRSPEFIRSAIGRATQNTTLDAEKRPNCIILDEIDGIDSGAGGKTALDALTAIISAQLKNASTPGKTAPTGKRESGGSGAAFALTRPLICICNDQHAPALRELRRLAEVHVFMAPSEMRLLQRLKVVCAKEGLQVSSSTCLTDLCQAAGGDIRSAINTLQFAAARTQQRQKEDILTNRTALVNGTESGAAVGALDIAPVLEAVLQRGLKDDQLDLHQVWREVFAASSAPSAATAKGGCSGIAPREGGGCMRAMDVMGGHGDFQMVMSGIFENVHRVAIGSSSFVPAGSNLLLARHSVTSEWLSSVDELNAFTTLSPDGFQVHQYIPVAAAAAKCYVGSAQRKVKIEFPRKVIHLLARSPPVLCITAYRVRTGRCTFSSSRGATSCGRWRRLLIYRFAAIGLFG